MRITNDALTFHLRQDKAAGIKEARSVQRKYVQR